MKRLIRVAFVLATLAVIATAGAASLRAADLIGGKLSANPDHVWIISTSTIPVTVVLIPDGPFTVTPDTFSLAPGEQGIADISGERVGRVSARISSALLQGMDTSSVTLNVRITAAPPPPPPFPWAPIGTALVALLALALVARRVRHFRFHITRVD